jgi:xanthine/CO dehydrogenase XdhC/CoxF family maturation factor
LLRQAEGARTVILDGVEILCEHIPPPTSLIIFGAGHDVVPLVAAAKAVGWYVTVVDRRPAYAQRDRLPAADEVVAAEPAAAKTLTMDARTAVVVMTHNYLSDLEILRGVIAGPACYIGMLGPMVRTHRILGEIRESGFDPTPEQLARLYAPIGLDIGAEGPDEIALSIVAEIQAATHGQSGKSLKGRTVPLH